MSNAMHDVQSASRFKGEVLNRIYRIWLFRKFLPVVAGEIAVISFFLYWLGRTVFVQKVFENAIRVFFAEPTQIITFLGSAFSHASTPIKFLSIAIIVLIAFLLRHLTQGMLRLILVRENYFSRVGK